MNVVPLPFHDALTSQMLKLSKSVLTFVDRYNWRSHLTAIISLEVMRRPSRSSNQEFLGNACKTPSDSIAGGWTRTVINRPHRNTSSVH